MKKIDFTLRLVTPAFAGGAEQAKSDGIRPPTVKALLRFWWRTMHGDLPPDELFEREAELFGSTDKGQGVRIVPRNFVRPASIYQIPDKNKEDKKKNANLCYFAYGPVENDSLGLGDGYSQAFSLYMPPHLSQEILAEIMHVLWLLSAFSGLGSRSRHGWGSLKVCDLQWPDNLHDPHQSLSASDLVKFLAKGLSTIYSRKDIAKGVPEYTAFSKDSRLLVGKEVDSWEKALNAIALDYHAYHQKLGANPKDREKVGPDCKKRRTLLRHGPKENDTAPFGTSFGLPQNAFFKPGEETLTITSTPADRRASPLFFKIVTTSNNNFLPIMLWLPAVFLPKEVNICAKIDNNCWSSDTALAYPGSIAIEEFICGTNRNAQYPLNQPGFSAWEGLITKGWEEVTW